MRWILWSQLTHRLDLNLFSSPDKCQIQVNHEEQSRTLDCSTITNTQIAIDHNSFIELLNGQRQTGVSQYIRASPAQYPNS